MPLDPPAGTELFIDANIFCYAIIPIEPFTQQVLPFIDGIRRGTWKGCTDTRSLLDAQHKIMLSLAAAQYGLERRNLVGWLKKHPEKITTLVGLEQAAVMLDTLPIRQLPSDDRSLRRDVAATSRTFGLLTSDALIMTLMRRYGITRLATNDDDFDRVPDIMIHKPR